MNKAMRLKIGPVAVLVLLALLTILAVHRKGLTAAEAETEAVGTVVKVEDMAVRDEFATVAFLALLALFAFVTWTALRTNKAEDRLTSGPPSEENHP